MTQTLCYGTFCHSTVSIRVCDPFLKAPVCVLVTCCIPEITLYLVDPMYCRSFICASPNVWMALLHYPSLVALVRVHLLLAPLVVLSGGPCV